MSPHPTIAIIGAGIVGAATARALLSNYRVRIIILEAEDRPATHQSGHNSGVIHSGLYYRPSSLKARNCVAGREAMYRYCAERGIPHRRTGKLVIARTAAELPALKRLERRGQANGLAGLRWLSPAEFRVYEPHACGLAGLWVSETGVVDYAEVTRAFIANVRAQGADVRLGERLIGCRRSSQDLKLETTRGNHSCAALVNCGGLWSDRVARLCGVEPGVHIIPFRGEYYAVDAAYTDLIKTMIYPVPDPRLPFLGVHLTRTVNDRIEAGPNAVLAWRRAGYRPSDVSWSDVGEMMSYAGFWRMAVHHARTGVAELARSLSKRSFVNAVRELVPAIPPQAIQPSGAGVRAQAVDRLGRLLDDFRIVEAERMIHVLNAPSPAATASIPIGEEIARMAAGKLGLRPRAVQPTQAINALL